MILNILRLIFLIVSGVLGWYIGTFYKESLLYSTAIGLAIGFVCLLLEFAFARKFISVTAIVFLGVIFGFIISYFFIHTLYLIPSVEAINTASKKFLEFSLTLVVTFISVIALIHCKDDFKFVVPFIEFKKEIRSGRRIILDTSAIIDGRIYNICETGLIDTVIILPRFVLNELHLVADSSDKLKRNRGRRGLDILNKMRESKKINLEIQDVQLPHIKGVDGKLIFLAKALDARIVTTDFNLARAAMVEGVEVVNINDVLNASKPFFLHGEQLNIKIVKIGENPNQGVGYLDDGTMVVSEGSSHMVGREIQVVITNIVHTSAGRIIFGKPIG